MLAIKISRKIVKVKHYRIHLLHHKKAQKRKSYFTCKLETKLNQAYYPNTCWKYKARTYRKGNEVHSYPLNYPFDYM